jgi:hypothetical protein
VGTAAAGARKFDAETDFTCQYANRSAEPPVRIELYSAVLVRVSTRLKLRKHITVIHAKARGLCSKCAHGVITASTRRQVCSSVQRDSSLTAGMSKPEAVELVLRVFYG